MGKAGQVAAPETPASILRECFTRELLFTPTPAELAAPEEVQLFLNKSGTGWEPRESTEQSAHPYELTLHQLQTLPTDLLIALTGYGSDEPTGADCERFFWASHEGPQSLPMLHRDYGLPAAIGFDGTREWYDRGLLHRDDDKPAFIGASGTREWYDHGLLHRDDDKPARIRADGTREWYDRGSLHRDGDRPALIRANGMKVWYQHGRLHRENDKPALIAPDGTQVWFFDGERHRAGGKPAFVHADGTQEWYEFGKLLRTVDPTPSA